MQSLVLDLRGDNYHVLQAEDAEAVLAIVRFHSRPIHLALLEVSSANADLARLLQRYRPRMRLVFVTGSTDATGETAFAPEVALSKAREILKMSKGGAMHVS